MFIEVKGMIIIGFEANKMHFKTNCIVNCLQTKLNGPFS